MDSLRHSFRFHVASPVIVGVVSLAALAVTPAALAYEGYGYQTAGGQGGDTCHVTNLAASGAGSFVNCVESRGAARIVVFDVAGTITLDQTLYITMPYLTIDGTSAPAPGITIRPQNSGRTALAIENTHDIIVKGIRLQGYGTEDGADLLRIDGDVGEVHHIVADHLTLAAADDGAMDITSNARDITVSWCFFYGGELTQLIKYGIQRRISVHHNVYANTPPKGERNPLLWGDLADFDYVNNVVYGWYYHGVMVRHEGDVGNTGRVKANIVNNLFSHVEDATIQDALVYGSHPGPDAEDGGPAGTPAQGTVVTSTKMGQLWVSGNILPPLNQDQYSTVSGPLPVPTAAAVTTWPASELKSRVLPSVGTGHRTSTEQALLDVVAGGAAPTTHTLSVAKAGTGSGTITSSSPAGISCGTDCSETYSAGTVVTLSQAATVGSTFAGWSGACTGTGACQVTMNAAKSVTATFNLIPNTLTVTKGGDGGGTVTSTPAGISCGADCSETYSAGTVVTLSQAATVGSTFTGWSGACTGTGACQVTMNAAKSVTATFDLIPNTLTVTKGGNGGGTVTSTPAGISCGADCSETYSAGTVVTLSQAATVGSTFTGWSGACTGTGACQVTMNAAKSVTATFDLIPNTLTVTKGGNGGGTVTSTPAGISCGADCSETYSAGTVVTLSQAATVGSSFTGWSGACTGTGACQVTMNAAKSVTATFSLTPNTLTVTKGGNGGGTVTSTPAGISCGADCSETYSAGTVVTLSQAATVGSSFTGWSGACAGTGACQVTMDAAKSVTATFNLIPNTLTVTKGGNGGGTVTSTPAGISCGADCSETYSAGTVVTLSQAATVGSSFTGWSGACTGTGACQVTMNAAKSVTASFTLNINILSVTRAGTGSGSVSSSPAGISCGSNCSENYNFGMVVTLSQAATTGSSFAGWSGACTGTGACQVTMDAVKLVTATFTRNTHTLTVARAGTGTGTVTSSPAGISCGVDCSEVYNSGTVLTLSQAATTGSSFAGWSGACTGTGACQVTMDAAKSVTATFNGGAATTISVSDASVTEGNAGSVNAAFTVSLSAGFATSVSVGYAVTSLTAGPGDFTASTGTLTFPAGTTALPLLVPVQGDLVAEGNETFLVTLVSSSHGAFADSQGVGTIFDDDGLPSISIEEASVTEGDAGQQVVLLRVSLSSPAGLPVKVSYSTANVTALAGSDYLRASGSLLFPEGTVAGELALWVSGDALTEAAETFTVNLKSPENATLAKGAATVTIVDNDPMPALTVTDVRVTEGHVGSRNAVFKVTLSAAAPADVNVDWRTSDLTAKVGEDYVPSSGTLTIRKGLRSGTIPVPVLGDLVDERNEAFLLSLLNPVGARIIDAQAQGVVWDDDGEKDPAVPIASLPYVATRSGRYRLVGDRTFAPARGAAVTVSASGVVLDLDGHTLSGSAGAATEAFGVLSRNRSSVTVQNGKVQGFLTGVFLAGPSSSKFAVRNLRVHSSTYAGIWLEGRGNQVDACEVVGTGGTTALGPGSGAVGISSVGVAPKLTQNQVRDTVAPSGGDAFGIAADRATSAILSGNLVKNTSSVAISGILVTRATRASVTLNTLDTLDYGVVFTGGARGTCEGNRMTVVATPTMGVTCEP